MVGRKGRMSPKFEFEGSCIDINELFRRFPFFTRRMLAEVGVDAVRGLVKHIQERGITQRYNRTNSLGVPLTGGTFAYRRGVVNRQGQYTEYPGRYKHRTSGRRMASFAVDPKGRFVQVKSFPLNVLRVDGSRGSARTEGEAILEDFRGSFNAAAAARKFLDGIGRDYFADAEKRVRGSFGNGESPFGAANAGRTRVSREAE
jgi:hypothetical protein